MIHSPSPSSTSQSLLSWSLAALYGLAMAWLGWLATQANLDLADGRHVLFMDERITFDGVKAILHAPDWRTWFDAVVDGRDHRYGRSLWNAIAPAAWLPEHLWGEKGQIVAGRMVQLAWLMAACAVFSFGLLKNGGLRLAMLAAMMGMPFAAYYMTMPKPEPQQLFWLALFFMMHTRRPQDARQWLWMGLALGTKISTLPIVLVCAAAARLARSTSATAAQDQAWRLGSWRLGPLFFLMLGLGLAVPLLLPTIALATVSWHGIQRIRPAFFSIGAPRWGLMLLIGLVDLLVNGHWIRKWYHSTLRNTAHGADSAQINALSWLDYAFNQWLGVPAWLGAGLLLSALALIAMRLQTLWQRQGARCLTHPWSTGALMLVSGMALNGAVFVGTHRLWGFYLVPGTVLTIAGLLRLIDERWQAPAAHHIAASTAHKATRLLPHAFLLLLLAVALLYWLPATTRELRQLAHRSQQADHRVQLASYAIVMETLAQWPRPSGRPLEIAQDPGLYPIPLESTQYRVREFWGPYARWDEAVDVLLFSRSQLPTSTPIPAGIKDHAQYVIAQQEYARRVRGPGCGASTCYRVLKTLPNGGEILVLAGPRP